LANHKSAAKRNRQSIIRKARNRANKTRMKGVVKAVNVAMEENSVEKTMDTLKTAISIIAKTATKGTYHKKNASRKISRLTKKVNAFVVAAEGEA
jgi:small subunit ribosomal protein S20